MYNLNIKRSLKDTVFLLQKILKQYNNKDCYFRKKYVNVDDFSYNDYDSLLTILKEDSSCYYDDAKFSIAEEIIEGKQADDDYPY